MAPVIVSAFHNRVVFLLFLKEKFCLFDIFVLSLFDICFFGFLFIAVVADTRSVTIIETAVWAVRFVANIRRDRHRRAKPAGPERPVRKGGASGGRGESANHWNSNRWPRRRCTVALPTTPHPSRWVFSFQSFNFFFSFLFFVFFYFFFVCCPLSIS